MKFAISAACLSLVLFANVASAAITFTNVSSTSTLHREAFPANRLNNEVGGQVALSSVTLPIANFSNTSIASDGQDFLSTFAQHRPGSAGSTSSGSTVATFTVDTNYNYTIDGSFGFTRGEASFLTKLWDIAAPLVLLENSLVSQSATSANVLSLGPLTGKLFAGHTYVWSVDAGLKSTAANFTGSTGIGIASLTLEELPAATPEPATLAIWSGIGLCGLITTYRRRKA